MSGAADKSCFKDKLLALIAEHVEEIRTRGIAFHTDIDSQVVFSELRTAGAPREEALRALLRFVLATVPDDCEVYFSVAQPASRMRLVGESRGEGVLTLRWQVAGDRRSRPEKDVVALRPRLGNAQAQIIGKTAQSLRVAFRTAGWPLSLEAVQGGEEIWLSAELS